MKTYKLEVRQYMFEDDGRCPWAELSPEETFLGILYSNRVFNEPQGTKYKWYVDILVAVKINSQS